ncbi:MAG: pyridoxal phosphate-dependent aminotransferase [SAR202 cluster bacterium]|jgi:aspartate/methionine/tyrosine aminotransferase|nr:pyridoxal phosphate-dependent aminotransferase [SAR202 cluster bacterium]MDP6798876.1 pyridoxal phosphate-dependent aminotransferase [SAR202 cluster bacterium]MQG59070.1 pyridoxal phosphate-dependent aminotransferase [SAR202 cluster bacterium]MQG68322.1 pyridoxal phosphate-dependent aminotransferase [SAR202 cluster bacterium]HAL47420.1 aspartate aminotransferase [Dehalococcoidia bacterium]|tara:strand:+ start:8718 stop:9881 length:1164 start_codon:yes stop_codon:yes gene_type:complete
MKLAQRMSRLGTETAFEVLAKARRLEAEGMNVIHLEIGEPDFESPENVVNAGSDAIVNGYTHYGPSPGFPELRDRIAEEISSTRGLSVTSDNVVVTPGGKPIMFFAILALVDQGDEVLYPNPGFPIYESMIEFVGGVPVPMQLHESSAFNVDVDEIAAQITDRTKLMIVNSPNNPCGSVIPVEDLERLANLAKEHDIVVLSDEIYNRFLYEGEHHSIAAFPGMRDRTIILDGFSKSYAMTGWRIGYGVMPQELVEPISRLATNSVSCTASFTQIAALEALSGPQESSYSMVEEFKKRRDIIVGGLNDIPGIRCPVPLGAFYVFPSIEDTGMSSQHFADSLLSEAGVASLAGESFGRFGNGYIRFSFANSTENLESALERIRKFVRSR